MVRAAFLIIAVGAGGLIFARAALDTLIALPGIVAEAESRRGW
jgi:hypothetical protein